MMRNSNIFGLLGVALSRVELHVLLIPLLASTASAVAGETRSYAVKWFDVAGYFYPHAEDCLHGMNRADVDQKTLPRRILTDLGYSPEAVDGYVAGDYSNDLLRLLTYRGRRDGK